MAVVTPADTVSSSSGLARSLPIDSQPGTPVPQAVRAVESAARAYAGARELVAPPAAGLLLPESHERWAG